MQPSKFSPSTAIALIVYRKVIPMREGNEITLGQLLDSVSLVVGDRVRADDAYLVFPGDTLFVGMSDNLICTTLTIPRSMPECSMTVSLINC